MTYFELTIEQNITLRLIHICPRYNIQSDENFNSFTDLPTFTDFEGTERQGAGVVKNDPSWSQESS